MKKEMIDTAKEVTEGIEILEELGFTRKEKALGIGLGISLFTTGLVVLEKKFKISEKLPVIGKMIKSKRHSGRFAWGESENENENERSEDSEE